MFIFTCWFGRSVSQFQKDQWLVAGETFVPQHAEAWVVIETVGSALSQKASLTVTLDEHPSHFGIQAVMQDVAKFDAFRVQHYCGPHVNTMPVPQFNIIPFEGGADRTV